MASLEGEVKLAAAKVLALTRSFHVKQVEREHWEKRNSCLAFLTPVVLLPFPHLSFFFNTRTQETLEFEKRALAKRSEERADSIAAEWASKLSEAQRQHLAREADIQLESQRQFKIAGLSTERPFGACFSLPCPHSPLHAHREPLAGRDGRV